MASATASRVRLRPVRDDDVEVFFDHQRDERAQAMAGVPARERAAFDAHWARIRADATVITRTITLEARPAGNVVSWIEGGRREIGYWISPQLWGRGIATRAVTLFVHEVAERPLAARVLADNAGSIRVLEKVGFALVPPTPPAHDQVRELRYELR